MKLVFALALAAFSSPAIGQECPFGTPDSLFVTGWSISADASNVTVEYRIENSGPAFRMIEAGILFHDALGAPILETVLDRDTAMAAGETRAVTRQYTPRHFEHPARARLFTIDRADVSVLACVVSIVTETGDVIRYLE